MSPKASRASTSLSPLSESLFARSPTALGLGIFSLPHSAKQSRVLAGALAADYSPVARGPQDPKSHRFPLSPPCLFLKQMFEFQSFVDGAKRLRRGPRIHLDNRYLAAWVREHGAWKSVAYQPTPIIDGDIHRALARGPDRATPCPCPVASRATRRWREAADESMKRLAPRRRVRPKTGPGARRSWCLPPQAALSISERAGLIPASRALLT